MVIIAGIAPEWLDRHRHALTATGYPRDLTVIRDEPREVTRVRCDVCTRTLEAGGGVGHALDTSDLIVTDAQLRAANATGDLAVGRVIRYP